MGRQENWGHEGMPPIYVNVLDKKPLTESKDYQVVKYWIEGAHPHMGRIIQGWTGVETEVTKVTTRFEGEERIRYKK